MMRKILIVISIILFTPIFIMLLTNLIINIKSKKYIFNDVNKIPYNKVGLLLGTSKFLYNGTLNEYFMNRIDAAVKLYNNKKINYIVVSGDNSRNDYNEPLDMKNELIANGIPDSVIYLDYAGFRTFDSVVRMSKIFGQDGFTIISQKSHNQRAVYIAQKKGLVVYGFNANDVSYSGFKTNLREKFARVKVFIDLLINKQPKYLGDPVEISYNQTQSL